MLQAGDRVIAGISGGADSICLLFLLLEWSKEVALNLAVVHVNHGIRKEAAEDANYVEALCKQYRLPFYLTEVDVHKKAKEEKCSEEEAGRKVRYEAFARAAEDFGAGKIAVAHNSNDRSETMLFNLFRGSGIKGLCGILPVRDNIIRPILCLERCEIENYLSERGIFYCQDITNEGDDYTRNRIRHHILPYVEKEIVQGCVCHMNQTAQMLAETEDYLEQQTQWAISECVAADGGIWVEKINALHPMLQKRVLHTLIKQLSPHQKDISYIHVQELTELFERVGNRSICLPFGIRGRRVYQQVFLELAAESVIAAKPNQMSADEYIIPIPAQPQRNWSTTLQWEKGSKRYQIDITLFEKKPCKKTEEVPQNQYTKWFDYDKIKKCLVVRGRKTGDYLTIADKEGRLIHKTLKNYMITQKIPREQRDELPLLTEENHVLWVIGHRISEYYKITENTKHILQVQWKEMNA